ncbi:MAG: helix-turn-helix domain-containing protein [Alphaproteobacteria bacterium]|nr:helix-turn-helix domain-containing protein [Alphaproteobacteria bacterium]MBU0797608.1 helix-turn-helix domain-containing protein [Alphaproteobacteria bacterium]MBU0886604.1 helix-turn-helix domain-containing protein [Alphaproteobacteria bacterium]MBU1812577.1 helix-turn-helix domain-containing protein [Alphaproteobacteria bacterium]
MPENTRRVTPLDWQRLINEALARRKEEGLTQREHAALAGVSVPTIASFDRAETTLTLTKAFDILRVVGLLKEQPEGGAQERFLRESFERWQVLTASLPKDNPARFSDGFYRVDYCLEGDLRQVSLREFEGVLQQAVTRYTGWPPFLTMEREDLAPREIDGAIETWLAPDGVVERLLTADPAHCDYWRGIPSGRMFLIRGYQEDGQETYPAGTVFDTTLPIWRMGEVLLHAERLAALMAQESVSGITVRLRVLYTGLQGRQLRNIGNPLSGMTLVGRPARSDEALLEAEFPAEGITEHLAEHLLPLAASLYERFDVGGLSLSYVEGEVARLLKGRF